MWLYTGTILHEWVVSCQWCAEKNANALFPEMGRRVIFHLFSRTCIARDSL